MIHSSYYKPRIWPYNGDITSAEIDRLQEFSGSISLNRDKINEIGRVDLVGWKTAIPSVTANLRQLEYGTTEFWTKITNLADGTVPIDQDDFKTSVVDFAGYKTDDNGTFLGTIWYPKMRCSGWGLNISDPDALVERSFSFVGEDQIAWTDNNKYLIQLSSTASGTGHQIVIGSGGFSTYPDPVNDPDYSGSRQIVRVLRVRSGTTTELTFNTDYTWNSSTNLMTFPTGTVSGDVFKVWYTASSYISGGSIFTNNDTDASGLVADSCSIYLATSTYVYRLQSVAVDVSFDRQDLKEIGNSEVVQRGVRQTNVRVTLGRILEDYTIEQILRGAASSYGKYDIRNYQDDIKLIIKVYSDKNKGTFLLGYSFNNLTPNSSDLGVPTHDYVNAGTQLTGETFVISTSAGDL